jgi:TetR/AcrR family transcriptional regulator, transcriptional repressor for nem operon
MPNGKGRKQATRQRIIDAAGRRFKPGGIDGSGIATLMGDAGLTSGAFYAHFDSKEDLVAATVAEQLRTRRESFARQAAEPDGMEQLVHHYLSSERRDHPEQGGPSAALLDEITRCGEGAKRAYTDGMLAVVEAIVDVVATEIASQDPQAARVKLLNVFAMMVGTLQFARALADRTLADQVLEQRVKDALALLEM